MITPLPAAWPEKPGSATLPFFGVVPAIVNEKGEARLLTIDSPHMRLAVDEPSATSFALMQPAMCRCVSEPSVAPPSGCLERRCQPTLAQQGPQEPDCVSVLA